MSNSPAPRLGRTTPATHRPLFAHLALERVASARLALVFPVLGCLLLVVTGCGLIPGQVTHYLPAPAVVLDSYDCKVAVRGAGAADLSDPASIATGSVPDGFVTAGVVRCREDLFLPSGPPPVDPSPTSASEPGYIIIEEHLGGDYAPLLAALAEPSDREDGGVCPAMAEIIPDVWLINAVGQAVHVQWPLDSCGFSKPGVMEALADLTVTSSTTFHVPVPGTGSEPSLLPGIPSGGPSSGWPASGGAE